MLHGAVAARTFSSIAQAAAITMTLAVVAGGCSLGNIPVDACDSDDECAEAFGTGSTCDEGYCVAAPDCETGHDCRRILGGGACVEGECVTTLPADPSGLCNLYEPGDLGELKLIGEEAPVVVGGMFFLNDSFGRPIRDAARLAVRQINASSGMNGGRSLAMVICDNFCLTEAPPPEGEPCPAELSSKIDAYTADNDAVIEAAVDYLAVTLGVPFVVGPLRSADSYPANEHVVQTRQVPTMLITPSATTALLSGDIDKLSSDDQVGLFWRTAPSDEFQARVLAQQVVGTYPVAAPIASVAIPFLNDEYGEGFQKIFQTNYSGSSQLVAFADGDLPVEIANRVEAVATDAVLYVDLEVDRAVPFIEEMAARPGLNTRELYLTDGSRDLSIVTGASAAAQTYLFTHAVGTAPASGQTPLFNTFKAALELEFGWDASAKVFTEHAYDATYAGAAAVVYASRNGNDYDGRQVALGMLLLTGGMSIDLGTTGWPLIKAGVTSGMPGVNLNGVSGDLDWDTNGEVKAPIEIWRPQDECTGPGTEPCLATVQTIPVSAL
jgi:ABC-type branched-subunit amino acid transport system substrate-binding protein